MLGKINCADTWLYFIFNMTHSPKNNSHPSIETCQIPVLEQMRKTLLI